MILQCQTSTAQPHIRPIHNILFRIVDLELGLEIQFGQSSCFRFAPSCVGIFAFFFRPSPGLPRNVSRKNSMPVGRSYAIPDEQDLQGNWIAFAPVEELGWITF